MKINEVIENFSDVSKSMKKTFGHNQPTKDKTSGQQPNSFTQRAKKFVTSLFKDSKDEEPKLKGFDAKTQYAIQKLKARYPHADDLLSALLADVDKNELDGDQADAQHDKADKDIIMRLTDLEKRLDNIENKVKEEITLEDTQDFHEEFGYLAYCEEGLFEAEYQGRTVKLNKPMQGDVKKFKVYVKNPKGNVVKVNFGDPNMRIKKSNPKRRKSFRARHNCDNPGPKHKARYWSCRKW
jgi:hypothetical protein